MNCVTGTWSSLCFLSTMCLFALTPPYVTVAGDESTSLALLVETLDASDADPTICAALMRGMLLGLEGRRDVTPPVGWAEVNEKLIHGEDAELRQLATNLSQIFGDRDADRRSLLLIENRDADVGQRRAALRLLLSQRSEAVAEVLERLLDDPALALDAIRGYSMIESNVASRILLGRLAQWDSQRQRAAIETLASRKSYADDLLTAIGDMRVPRDDIPAHVARSLSDLLGERFTKVFGPIRPISDDRALLMAKYRAILTPAALAGADASHGRVVFQKTCASCHLLYGEGGLVGPDLTGSNRANLDYILLNSVDPSYDVPDAYKMVQILTSDGRVINGVLAEEDAVRVVLRTAEQPRVVVAKADIETRRVSPKSMMPEGQLDQMKPQEVIDLIRYLQSTEQVEPTK